jgi:hypothetical protein
MEYFQHYSSLILSTVTCYFDPNLAAQLLEMNPPRCLCQQVRQLLLCRDVVELDPFFLDAVPDEVEPDVDMFAPIMEHQVLAQRNGRLIIHEQLWHPRLHPEHVNKEPGEPDALVLCLA